MADSCQSTPRQGKSVAASSFETAASTPSSLVETSSPGGEEKSKDKNGGKNKKKNRNKNKESAPTYDSSSITAEDLLEAGTSGTATVTATGEGSKAVEATEDIPMEESGSSDCEIVETGTVISGTAVVSRTRRGKRRRTEVEEDSEESLPDVDLKQTIGESSLDSMTTLSASTVAARAFEWITIVDNLRARSKNLQGTVSGNMKRSLVQVKRAITVLLARANAIGDPRHLKQKITDQSIEILKLQAQLDNVRNNERYYREQTAELGGSTLASSRRTVRPMRDAAIKSRIANRSESNLEETNMSSDDVFLAPGSVAGVGEIRESSTSEFTRRPEGISPERWRKRQLQNSTTEITPDFCNTNNISELKIFIKNQISEAIAGLRGGIQRDMDRSNKKGNLKERAERNEVIPKPKITKVQKIRTEVKMVDPSVEVDYPLQDGISWAEVTAKPRRQQAPEKIRRKLSEGQNKNTNKSQPKVRIPRLAAVSINCRNKEDYPKILCEAKSRINLQEIGITETTVGRSFSGALMILIPREEEKEKAPLLAEKLLQITEGREDVRISVPSKKGDVKLTQIDCSTSAANIVDAIVSLGGCMPGDVRVGEIRYSQRGNGSVIVQCPAGTANELVKLGKIKIGWSVVRVELMPLKLNKCFRCWETGHFVTNCRSEKDRSQGCFNCGETGHTAKECVEKACCPVCKDKNKPHAHQCGRSGCSLLSEADNYKEEMRIKRTAGRRPGPQNKGIYKKRSNE